MRTICSPGEALSEAGGEPVSNTVDIMDNAVAPLPLLPWAPEEDQVRSGELKVLVPVVEISVVWVNLVLDGRDLNVLPPPFMAVMEMEAAVVG